MATIRKMPLKSVLIDLSGTLHVENTAIEGAVDALKRLRKTNLNIKFVTNTTKESRRVLYKRLLNLGFELKNDEIYSSLWAAHEYIRTKQLRPMLLIDKDAMEDFADVTPPEGSPLNAVVVGLAPDKFHYEELTKAFSWCHTEYDLLYDFLTAELRPVHFKGPCIELCTIHDTRCLPSDVMDLNADQMPQLQVYLRRRQLLAAAIGLKIIRREKTENNRVRRRMWVRDWIQRRNAGLGTLHMHHTELLLLLGGADLVAIHEARYFKRSDGLALGPGAFIKGLEYSANCKAHVLGKPTPEFFASAITKEDPETAIMIGDDVRDDIAGAQAIGARGILVQTGKYRPGDETKIYPPPAFVCSSFTEAVDLIVEKLSKDS